MQAITGSASCSTGPNSFIIFKGGQNGRLFYYSCYKVILAVFFNSLLLLGADFMNRTPCLNLI